MAVREGKFVTSLVLPFELRAEVQAISDKTGESFGEIVRVALAAHIEQQKEKQLEAA